METSNQNPIFANVLTKVLLIIRAKNTQYLYYPLISIHVLKVKVFQSEDSVCNKLKHEYMDHDGVLMS